MMFVRLRSLRWATEAGDHSYIPAEARKLLIENPSERCTILGSIEPLQSTPTSKSSS